MWKIENDSLSENSVIDVKLFLVLSASMHAYILL